MEENGTVVVVEVVEVVAATADANRIVSLSMGPLFTGVSTKDVLAVSPSDPRVNNCARLSASCSPSKKTRLRREEEYDVTPRDKTNSDAARNPRLGNFAYQGEDRKLISIEIRKRLDWITLNWTGMID